MPRGSAVIRYEGKRGVVYRIKYVDAAGAQIMETLGKEADGWTARKAEAELRHRLTDVERDGKRRPKQLTFEAFAIEWLATYPDLKGLKRSTRNSYDLIIRNQILPELGRLRLETVGGSHLNAYMAKKMRGGMSGATINRHLNLVHLLFKSAVRQGLVRSNPADAVERPKEPKRKWTILQPADVAKVVQGFDALIAEAPNDLERRWRETSRTLFLIVTALGLRRGEVLGLRWRSVNLADPDGATLRVEETIVRGRVDTPKSETSVRTIALANALATELFDHRFRADHATDDDLVFPHPFKGTPADPARYAAILKLALAKAGITAPLRPFHDGRHTALTNAATAGNAPLSIQAQAGHSNFRTTQGYINLAGESFRAEAERAQARILAGVTRPATEDPEQA
jgi:integrase